jgi:hypothetical protein
MIDDYETADELAEAVEEQVVEFVRAVRAHDAALMELISKLRQFRAPRGGMA